MVDDLGAGGMWRAVLTPIGFLPTIGHSSLRLCGQVSQPFPRVTSRSTRNSPAAAPFFERRRAQR
jgi:hypothetical protein